MLTKITAQKLDGQVVVYHLLDTKKPHEFYGTSKEYQKGGIYVQIGSRESKRIDYVGNFKDYQTVLMFLCAMKLRLISSSEEEIKEINNKN